MTLTNYFFEQVRRRESILLSIKSNSPQIHKRNATLVTFGRTAEVLSCFMSIFPIGLHLHENIFVT